MDGCHSWRSNTIAEQFRDFAAQVTWNIEFLTISNSRTKVVLFVPVLESKGEDVGR